MINIKDINYAPNISEISSYIENPIFDEFYQYMNDKYKAVCKIEYSKDVWARGWNVKFRKSGKSLCVIYPKKTILLCWWSWVIKRKNVLKTCYLGFLNIYRKSITILEREMDKSGL